MVDSLGGDIQEEEDVLEVTEDQTEVEIQEMTEEVEKNTMTKTTEIATADVVDGNTVKLKDPNYVIILR